MALPIRLGLSFDGTNPPQTLRAIVELADGAGAINLWIASPLFHREPIACGPRNPGRNRAVCEDAIL